MYSVNYFKSNSRQKNTVGDLVENVDTWYIPRVEGYK